MPIYGTLFGTRYIYIGKVLFIQTVTIMTYVTLALAFLGYGTKIGFFPLVFRLLKGPRQELPFFH
jgi:hypothetical protein